MRLVRGITVLFQNGIEERIEINSGVQKAAGYDIYNEMQYTENSVKPKTDWRKITEDEYKVVVTNNPRNRNSVISIHELPADIKKIFKKLNLGSSIHSNDAHSRFARNKEETSLLSEALDSYLNKFSIKGRAKLHGLVLMPASLETTSFYYSEKNPTVKEYLGIHLDTSTEFKVYNEKHARNRICINLGDEDRHFLFINLTVSQIFKKLETANVDITKLDIGNVSEIFFKTFPNYPVFKIKLKPYEFYVAPTDNCLHDGSTIGMVKNDVTMSFLGYFGHVA